ncbi:hypothetical protein LOS8367_03685 [Limimaricola soesokkakensis]|uniref:6-hydroxymethylpterin diphosphokinase MptE-like domain-containing protein n=1 Tax=Limimaricola soesokkakensis TaxID=1343159 RepID=A0A1X7A785_9RHOB|nr:6-hydroxymethylpterin diphosphokinase MptE-like protein [Limimaricola soesokkakensis]SLN72220.1 hypothetical protein LOS8367_03685 [Limimaricola soesokkakensis]
MQLQFSNPETPIKKRILIFTDSRGQHKPDDGTYDIFAERLAKDSRLDVKMYLCPYKWTTTLDFLESFTPEDLYEYDHVVLYTGIVEWSPRPSESAIKDLYDNRDQRNKGNISLNTRDYSKKIINCKKRIFDEVFGESEVTNHLKGHFDAEYEGQKTNNLYSLDMAPKVIDRLSRIPNLVFLVANRFVPGWEGNFKRGRPSNISLTHAYADLFAEQLSAAGIPLVDLRAWDENDVQKYTCDNIHLTQAGSEYIYTELMRVMNMSPLPVDKTSFTFPNYEFSGFAPIERIDAKKKKRIMDSIKCDDQYLATLVIGVRDNPEQPERRANLKFLLEWIDHYYGDIYEVLIVEQDSKPQLDLAFLDPKSYVRHEFIYNPSDFNRGWGYNVAVRHFCQDAHVVALMDTDVLTGPNFLRDTIDCREKLHVVSPYVNIYYSDETEVEEIRRTYRLTSLKDKSKIRNPVTISGGVVIFNRSVFLAVKGFEQYVGYSCEDRALDVTVLNHIAPEKIKVSRQTYVHLHHPTDQAARSRFKEIYGHLTENYCCKYDPSIRPGEYIHKNCSHAGRQTTLQLLIDRAEDFGDLDLYKSGDQITVNGRRVRETNKAAIEETAIFPPDFKGLEDYPKREVYASAGQPDTADLRAFHNKYQGKRCFIIGNGPSLNKHDLSLLEDEYSFGVNSFYYKTRESGFRPTFYVVEDNSVMKENLQEIRNYDAPFKFFPTIYSKLHEKTPNTFFFEMNRGFYEKSSPNYCVPRFSTDASRVLYCGQSVTYINLQLAFYMGFTEVYLIGMDFDYIIPESHSRNGDVLTSDSDDPNHFHKDYFGKGKTWKDPKLERVLANYKMADLAFSSVGRKIYNATKGGKLEQFERVDYDVLLNNGKGSAAPIEGQHPETFCGIYLIEDGALSQRIDPDEAGLLLPNSVGSGVLLYQDPRSTLNASARQGDVKTTLERWQCDAERHLELYRQYRDKLTVFCADDLLSGKTGFPKLLEEKGLNISEFESAITPKGDPITKALAQAALQDMPEVLRTFLELQASSTRPRGFDFSMDIDDALNRLRSLSAKMQTLEIASRRTQGQLKEEQTTRALLEQQLVQLRATADKYFSDSEKAKKTIAELEAERSRLDENIKEILRSTSWQVTGPLRSAKRLISGTK